MLVWEGYSDPSFASIFEERTGCKVSSAFVGSNDEFAAKLSAGGGGVYDLITPSTDTTTIMIKLGLVEPIDTSRLPHWNEVFESFRNSPTVNVDGKVWGVIWDWGSIPMLYRPDKVDPAPTSFSVLWDPKYQGRIAVWDDKSALYMTARMLYGRDTNVYDLSDEQLEEIVAKLIEQKPLVRKYWATMGELINLYANGEIDVSNAWEPVTPTLAKQGITVQPFIPDERADGWSDAWMIVKGTKNIDCAYAWIDFALSPEGQCGNYRVGSYAGTNPEALKTCVTPEEYSALHQDDPAYL
ncbi:MAG TPA: ABC transporter substrate-binding protein, partial [Alphaproteobacteria bacterium]|nr:ABC transporter substrate-binding protein [Alphaproteobacteria bacterium]